LSPGSRRVALYKYELLGPDGVTLPLKADPVAWQAEPPPGTASVVADPRRSAGRTIPGVRSAPVGKRRRCRLDLRGGMRALGSANRTGRSCDWSELAERLVDYVARMGLHPY